MPAINLVYVRRNDAFDCADQLPSAGRVKYAYLDRAGIPAIADPLLAPLAGAGGTTLVIASHGGPGGVDLPGGVIGVSAYAQQIVARTTQGARIVKIVYLICSARHTMVAIPGVRQLAPDGLLTLSGGQLQAEGGTLVSVPTAVARVTTGNGWTYL